MLSTVTPIYSTRPGDAEKTQAAGATGGSKGTLTKAMINHRRRTPGTPFSVLSIELQSRLLEGNEGFSEVDHAVRKHLLQCLAQALPANAIQEAASTIGTVSLFLPGKWTGQTVSALQSALDAGCDHSLLLDRHCHVARWRSAMIVSPADGHAPVRLTRLLRERLFAAPWSQDRVGERVAAAAEAKQAKAKRDRRDDYIRIF